MMLVNHLSTSPRSRPLSYVAGVALTLSLGACSTSLAGTVLTQGKGSGSHYGYERVALASDGETAVVISEQPDNGEPSPRSIVAMDRRGRVLFKVPTTAADVAESTGVHCTSHDPPRLVYDDADRLFYSVGCAVHRLDERGDVVWKRTFAPWASGDIGAVAAGGGRVAVCGGSQRSPVIMMSADTGEVLWSKEVPRGDSVVECAIDGSAQLWVSRRSAPRPGTPGGVVLERWSDAGELLAQSELLPATSRGAPTADGGFVYIAGEESERLVAVDGGGAEIWSRTFPLPTYGCVGSSPIIDIAADEGAVAVAFAPIRCTEEILDQPRIKLFVVDAAQGRILRRSTIRAFGPAGGVGLRDVALRRRRVVAAGSFSGRVRVGARWASTLWEAECLHFGPHGEIWGEERPKRKRCPKRYHRNTYAASGGFVIWRSSPAQLRPER